MNDQHVINIVKDKIGLNADSIGKESISTIIRERMQWSGVSTPEKYAELIRSSHQEWTELVEQLVVPETWFMRDTQPFRFLGKTVRSWTRSHPDTPINILSIPCSSGEEPYSIAITLLECGVPTENIRIDGIDISARLLEKAKSAEFTEYSFRKNDDSFRTRYFEQTGNVYRLSPKIRELVTFRQGNILEIFKDDKEVYDVIFCRNLLIYFISPAKKRTIAKLHRLLKPEGLLFVGHAEHLPPTLPLFEPVEEPRSFAYKKIQKCHSSNKNVTGESDDANELVIPADRTPIKIHRQPQAESFSRGVNQRDMSLHPFTTGSTPSFTPSSTDDDDADNGLSLDKAGLLANQGRLSEAECLCREFLKKNGPHAEAYYILGIVKQARNDYDKAEDCYGKAIYLNDRHYNALVNLSLLLEHRGNYKKSLLFRERASRIQDE